MKTLFLLLLSMMTFGAMGQGQKFNQYPNTGTLQSGDLLLLSRGGLGTFNITGAQLDGRYDAAGAAHSATNGFPWGTLYDPTGTALAVGAQATNNTFAVSNLLASLSQTIANSTSNSLQTGMNTLGSNLTNDVNTTSNSLQSQITAGGITAVQATNINNGFSGVIQTNGQNMTYQFSASGTNVIQALSQTIANTTSNVLTLTNDPRSLRLTNSANTIGGTLVGGTLVGGTNTLQLSTNGVTISGPLVSSNDFQLGPNLGALVYQNNHVVVAVNNALGALLVGNNSGSYDIAHSYFFSGQGVNGSFFNLGAGVAINTNNVPSHGKLDVWGNGWFSGSVTAGSGFAGDGSAVTNLQTTNIVGLLAVTNASASTHVKFDANTNLISSEDATGYTNTVSWTHEGTTTNITASFTGTLQSFTVTNGPTVFIGYAGANGSVSYRFTTNVSLVFTYQPKWLSGSNNAITNGVLSLTSYGGTNATQIEAAIGENQ